MSPERQEQLKTVLTNMQTIEESLMKSQEIAKHGDAGRSLGSGGAGLQEIPRRQQAQPGRGRAHDGGGGFRADVARRRSSWKTRGSTGRAWRGISRRSRFIRRAITRATRWAGWSSRCCRRGRSEQAAHAAGRCSEGRDGGTRFSKGRDASPRHSLVKNPMRPHGRRAFCNSVGARLDQMPLESRLAAAVVLACAALRSWPDNAPAGEVGGTASERHPYLINDRLRRDSEQPHPTARRVPPGPHRAGRRVARGWAA